MSEIHSLPKNLQAFQHAFGRQLRDPSSATRLKNIPARRSGVYEELLFNNICSFIDRCFPVAKQLIPAKKWRQLCRSFYKNYRCDDPIFANIPYHFLSYLNESPPSKTLPKWFCELLHYEWMELAVDMDPCEAKPHFEDSENNVVRLNGTLKVLSYQWPVHKIGSHYRPRKIAPFFTLVYRDLNHKVHFIEVNELTAHFINFAQQGTTELAELTPHFAQLMNWQDIPALSHFVSEIFARLRQHQAAF